MGAWGPRLYQDDIAEDVRDYYKDQLHRGKSGTEITQELLKQNEYALSDPDDAPVFWFALADTQWSLGRLEDFVKENALYHLHEGSNIKRWEDENPKGARIRAKLLSDLEQKLNSPQPAEKKISQNKLYHCKWSLGDTFAYQLESDLAKEKGLFGRYFLIQKVSERTWYPGHIVPIAYVKITKDERLPSNMEEFNQLEYVQTWFTRFEERFWPINMADPQKDIAEKSKIHYEVDAYGFLPQYRVTLLSTSARVIPKKLICLGNFLDAAPPKGEFVPHCVYNNPTVSWGKLGETFEKTLIDRYCGHNLRQLKIYSSKNGKN